MRGDEKTGRDDRVGKMRDRKIDEEKDVKKDLKDNMRWRKEMRKQDWGIEGENQKKRRKE